MIKSEKNIERDLFRLIKASPLAEMVTGSVYRKDMRPDNSSKEDIVVKFLAGEEGQIQTGIVVVNIYVPDITSKQYSHPIENTKRVEEIEDAVIAFVRDCKDNEYLYELDSSPISLSVQELFQHVVYSRIKYKRIID